MTDIGAREMWDSIAEPAKARTGVSIASRLLVYCVLYAVVLIGLTSFALWQNAAIQKSTEILNRTSLPGTRILANMNQQLAAFRHAESMLLFDIGMQGRDQGSALLSRTWQSLEELETQFEALSLTTPERERFQLLHTQQHVYLAAHARWAKNKADGTIGSATAAGEQLSGLYEAAANALDDLTVTSMGVWETGAREAETAAAWMNRIFAGMLTAGVLLAGWLMFEIRQRVSKPITSITRALAAIANGDTHVVVPESGRRDEIGVMAKALEVFRQNVWALEQAHAATEEAQRHAEALARHDALTGLPNRRVFLEELDHAIESAGDGGMAHAVLLLDLDRFKPVNDTHGHAVGDGVLCEVASRLQNVAGANHKVTRLGGDEFALIAQFDCGRGEVAQAAIKLANRAIQSVSEPIFVGNARVEIGVSIGAACCASDGENAEELLRAADIAMYRAKQEGRGTVRFFERSMGIELTERTRLEADLRQAITDGEIEAHYQPIVAMADNRLLGFEILARWNHRENGLLAPAAFIPLAEETGLIHDLTFQILRRACREASGWPRDLTLSLNLSPLQLQDTMLPTRIMAILFEADFPPNRLEIEITETALVADLDMAKSILSALQGLGIKISLHDFGTCYSGLYHLRELKLDKIKIDKSFVQSMSVNPESKKIVHAILGLTKSLGVPTVAEGIETADLLDLMTKSGCEFGQGFYFGKPMPATEAHAHVRQEHCRYSKTARRPIAARA